MRFKSTISEIPTFTKLIASLNLLGNITWMRLDDNDVRFTVIPEVGSQAWAVLPISAVFAEDYGIQSASEANIINLEVPLAALHRALASARDCTSANLRLTKKAGSPLLCLTIVTSMSANGPGYGAVDVTGEGSRREGPVGATHRETTISQDVPIRVLPATAVAGIHEPRCKEPEVHILLPPLLQIKMVSERFTRIALAAKSKVGSSAGLLPPGTSATGSTAGAGGGAASVGPGTRLTVSANMHGELRISLKTDALHVASEWKGLLNPELDPNVVEGGAEGVTAHPSTRWRKLPRNESWATVRVEAKDWGRVLGIGRLGGRVVACFCDEVALILYVYLPREDGDEPESVVTYYIGSYSE